MNTQKIVAEVGFNYDDDKREFGEQDKIINLYHMSNEDGQEMLTMVFKLGRKEDDTMNLSLPYREFISKIGPLELSED